MSFSRLDLRMRLVGRARSPCLASRSLRTSAGSRDRAAARRRRAPKRMLLARDRIAISACPLWPGPLEFDPPTGTASQKTACSIFCRSAVSPSGDCRFESAAKCAFGFTRVGREIQQFAVPEFEDARAVEMLGQIAGGTPDSFSRGRIWPAARQTGRDRPAAIVDRQSFREALSSSSQKSSGGRFVSRLQQGHSSQCRCRSAACTKCTLPLPATAGRYSNRQSSSKHASLSCGKFFRNAGGQDRASS